MEHEGIFYFFEYAEDGHTLVLTDALAKLKPAEGYETVPFHFEDGAARRDRDFLSGWEVTSSLRPKAYTHTDYNFEKPSLSLLAQSEAEPVAGLFKGEHYRQPGAHLELDRGRRGRGDPPRGAAGAARADPRRPARCAGWRPGCMLQARRAFRATTRTPSTWCCAPTTAWSIPEFRAGIGGGRRDLPGRADGGADRAALPAAAADAAAGDARAADRDGGRAVRRGDLHRRVCPGEGAVPLGPAGQAGREQLLLRAGLAGLGGRGLGLHPDPAHRPGGDRRLHRGRPGPADHHRPGLQRRRDAALRAAGQRHAVGLEVELLARAAAATTS